MYWAVAWSGATLGVTVGHTRGNLNHSDALLRDLGASASRRSLATGDVLVEQGDEADEVFVVLAGRLEAVNRSERGELVVGSVGPGHVVGEVTVIAGGRRTATLRVVEPAEVAVIARRDFERWLADNPEATDAVSDEARARIDRSQVATMIAELVGDAEPTLVQEVLDQVVWRHLAAGELLFEQGDTADACFFVVAGRLLVSARAADGTSVPLAELGRGEVVGELGLLDRAPRSATVRALRDTTLAVFSAEVFDGLVTRSPALMLHVARALLTRFRVTPRRAFRRAAVLTIAATGAIDSATRDRRCRRVGGALRQRAPSVERPRRRVAQPPRHLAGAERQRRACRGSSSSCTRPRSATTTSCSRPTAR